MKFPNRIKYLALSLILILSACSTTDEEVIANAISNLCPAINGPSAIYWDIENGIPRTDFPNGIPPTVDNIGGSFSHTDFPLLGFTYPVNWTPEQLSGNGTVGVNMYKGDNSAFWRYVAYSAGNVSGVRDVRDFEINAILNFFGLGANIETVCVNQQSTTVVNGINIATDNIMFRAGNMTAVVIASLTFGNAIPIPQANVKVAVAESAEFDQQVFDAFLAIEWQLLVRDPDTLYDGDFDNDGTPDVLDNFPEDPTRS